MRDNRTRREVSHSGYTERDENQPVI